MRFKAGIQNVSTFNKFTASLVSLGPVAWMRLDDAGVRFTIIPEQGTQVWSVLSIDTIFDNYTIESASPGNQINMEVPLAPLQRALKSALQNNTSSVSLRLTKKDNTPVLALTITASSMNSTPMVPGGTRDDGGYDDPDDVDFGVETGGERDIIITQDIPVRVLSVQSVAGLHEPRTRDPEVHILLPSLMQLKGISDRFTKLALETTTGTSKNSALGPKLEMSANAHGCLRLRLRTDAMNITSLWTGLTNPDLDPSQVDGGVEGLQDHPSTRMKGLGSADGSSEEGWATVRIDGKDWSKVLSVGRLGGRVIACFCHEHALILYVYLANDEDGGEDSVLTYYISSYSA